MKSKPSGVQKYFDRVPKQWDTLYSQENWFKYVFNKWLRKGLYERYRLTFEHCGSDLAGAKVLDIGCGTGRYSIECVKRGADKVIGIDFAPSMIEFSKKIAQQMNVADKCEFVCGDFLTYEFAESFDIVLALGFFDYIKSPEPIFKKIAQFKPHKFVASFPNYNSLWNLHRTIRYYWIKKCPVYNYTKERLDKLYHQAAFPYFQVIPCKKGFLGIAETKLQKFSYNQK